MTHQCTVCLKHFDFVSKLRRHQLTHSGLRPFTCYICLKSFRQSAHLKGHLRRHANSSRVSLIVSQAIQFQKLDSNHAQAQISEGDLSRKNVWCSEEARNESECEFQSDELNKQTHEKHQMTNKGQMSDVVQENYDGFNGSCHKEFHNSRFSNCTNILSNSANTESSEKLDTVYIREDKNKPSSFMEKKKISSEHQCGICLKCFSVPSKLQRHLLIHSSLRPFCCEFCPEAFHQLSQLRRHLSTHSPQRQIEAFPGSPMKLRECLEKPSQNLWTEEAGDFDKQPKAEPILRVKSLPPAKDQIKHVCPVCRKCFSAPSKLRRHVLIHTGQRPFQCSLCSQAFRQLSHLKAHYSVHVLRQSPGAELVSEARPKRSVHISFAKKLRAAKQKLKISTVPKSRIRDNIPEDDLIRSPVQKINSCSVCSKHFSAPSKLQRHILIHTGLRPFRCSVCLQGFRQKSHLKTHKCKGGSSGTFQSSMSEVHQREPDSSRSTVNIRMEDGIGKESLLSTFGSKAVPEDGKDLTPPSYQSTGSGNQCAICFKVFDFPSKLSRHLLIHMDIKPFTCNICSKSFRQLCHLQNHSRVHRVRTNKRQVGTSILETFNETGICTTESGELPIIQSSDPYHNDQKIDLDDKSSLSQSLNVEEIPPNVKSSSSPGEIHTFKDSSSQTNILANQCMFCLKTFSFPSKLSRHLMVHTGVRPYKCRICSKSFKQLSHLRNHQWVHCRNETGELKASTVDHQAPNSSSGSTPSDKINLDLEASESLSMISQGCDGYTVHHQQWCSKDTCCPDSGHFVRKVEPETDLQVKHDLDPFGTKRTECLGQQPENTEFKHLNRAKTGDVDPPATHISARSLVWNSVDQQEMVETGGPGSPAQMNERTDLHSFPFCVPDDLTHHQRDSRNVDGHDEHLTEPPNDMLICPSCSQCFDSVQNLDAHTCPVHHPEQRLLKSYQCAICFKGFDAPSKLKRHYVIHTGQRPYLCNRCDKDYTQSGHLKKHMLSHS